MSLTRAAIRLSAVRALRAANTYCGQGVRDSEQAAIEELDGNAERPYLVVYTDSVVSQPGGRGLLVGGDLDLLIEITMTPKMIVVTDDETGEQKNVWVDTPTDPAMELTVDIIERQIRNGLMNARNPWAEILRSFVSGFRDVASHRGASHREGLRFVGRQVKLTCDTVMEPAPGEAAVQLAPGTRWGTFLAALRAEPDPRTARIADLFEAELRGDTTWTPGEVTRGNWGLTAAEARALIADGPA